ncbi:IS3 family transposase, partial [Clostridium neonatale]
LRGEFKLKDILAVVGFPKATYMYWQKRFNRENPNKGLEEKILEIRSINKDWGYRHVYGALRKQGILINKKKIQRIMQIFPLQERVVSIVHTMVKLERFLLTEFIDVLTHRFLIRKAQQILLSLSIMRLMIRDE